MIRSIVKITAALIFFFPTFAYAYLDPGTGNALLAALFGIIGSAAFFSKNLYYKIKGKLTGVQIKEIRPAKLAIFSEGKRYWVYYKDIINELIKRDIPFVYYTLEVDDPAFNLLDYGNPEADLEKFHIKFAGNGNRGFATISSIKEPVILSTTPNIGTEGYPVKKSADCKNLIHIFHATGGIEGYHKYSLDKYDTAILSGPVFEEGIRVLEKKRNLSPKSILVGGLPYMDSIIERARQFDFQTNGKTVLIASTWKRSSFSTYGSGFIAEIALAGYDVIIRPHPYSYLYEADLIAKIQEELKPYPNVQFDSEVDNLKSLARADILISDMSGIRFDFLLAYNRPVITLETSNDISDEYEYSELDSYWDLDVSDKIGAYVPKEEMGRIVDIIKSISTRKTKVQIEIDPIVSHRGTSAKVISDQLAEIISSY